MACRFPDAETCEQFGRNLAEGRESIRRYSKEELRAQGAPEALIDDPAFVPAAALLSNVDRFDAELFGLNPREAALLDPQQRILLECAWEALEAAGYDPVRYARPIGIFAGAGVTAYAFENLREEYRGPAGFEAMLANDKDFLVSRIAYKLNLKGPAISVQTACSTSLVAVHLACQSLLAGDCDMALAGGVSVRLPHIGGYLYQAGMIASPDGHCRAFDGAAAGTVAGSGAGIAVLKRLDDAIADGDSILAVIRGSAVNNDGMLKAGFTAPSAAGQAAAIREAMAVAGIEPSDIGYVEAHGTGTPLGDPIEIEALNEAFRGAVGRCALGSVKTNIGHTDTAAGIAGLMKTVLAMRSRELPPSLHFERANPDIRFADGPFEVVRERRLWEAQGPRRAGVSSFGIGGTNAHVVLEEWCEPSARDAGLSGPVAIPVSAASAAALESLTSGLADWLEGHPEASLASVAMTLATGRRELNYRTFVAARDCREAAAALRRAAIPAAGLEPGERPVAFLFSGQGTQQPGMARAVIHEPVFRERFERLAAIGREETGEDFIALLVDAELGDAAAQDRLRQTSVAQPALFALEEALARLLMSWGIVPGALLGHSLGEFSAAAIAGVFEAEDAMRLVCRRGRLMQSMPAGAMLAVPLGEADFLRRMGEELCLAAVNGPRQCVVSGPFAEIEVFEAGLRVEGFSPVRLRTSHAFHSAMMEPVREEFAREVARVRRGAPRIPVISNLTGRPMTAEQAADPQYWASQLRDPVRFGDGVALLKSEARRVLVEIGPGNVLAALAGDGAVSTVRLAETVGQLWQRGVAVDWSAYHAGRGGSRVSLPTYPFQRQRYWIDAADSAHRKPMEQWFYLPGWKPAPEYPAGSMAGLHFWPDAEPAQVLDAMKSARCLTLISRGAHAEFTGMALAAARELPDRKIRCIELAVSATDADAAAALENGCPGPVIAWRSGRAWAPAYQPVAVAAPEASPLRERLVCVITGGSGGVGMALAERLAKSARARVALISRSAASPECVRRIEAAGGEAMVLQADVADEAQMRAALDAVRLRFEAIHGAIHAAGVAGGGLLTVRPEADAARVMRPKVAGARVLAELLERDALDFLVFCSSVTAVTGAYGQADYIAANAFLDRFAEQLHARGVPAMSIAWDTWGESGMAVAASVELRELWKSSLADGIRDAEGGDVLMRLLASPRPRVVVSTTALEPRLHANPETVTESLNRLESSRKAAPVYPRPAHLPAAVEPATEQERRVCAWFAENLGFERIGAEDDYFECGGDSLRAVSLVNSMQAALGETVHVTAIFEAPTPRRLAAYLETHYASAAAKPEARLTAVDVAEFRRALPGLAARAARPGRRNPRAVFLLAPPRTGSTLVRAMLAGHPKLFAPPELALLSYNTFGERSASVPGDAGLLEGPAQALRAAMDCDEETARRAMARFAGEVPVAEFYAHLQGLIGDRLLVDKTPHYVLSPDVLRRAEEDFEEPLYLMLQRHPYGMIRSYVESKIDLLLPERVRNESRFSRRQLGELIWLEGYRNMREFSRAIPAHRQHWLRFEDVTAAPRGEMARVCEFLGIEYSAGMEDPYRGDEQRRMTGGAGAVSRMLGDVKFHRYTGVDGSVAERWREEYTEDFLCEESAELARAMGYGLIADAAAERAVDEMTDEEVEAELARYIEQTA